MLVSALRLHISVGWTCPVLLVLCLPPPRTPACIHSDTHTRAKYASCCILATGKVITERAKELACCRAAGLIPERQQSRAVPTVASADAAPWISVPTKWLRRLGRTWFSAIKMGKFFFFGAFIHC